MPWTWDSRLDSHPPGEAAMRDFEDCHSWTRAPRRHAASPAVQAGPSRKRGARVPPCRLNLHVFCHVKAPAHEVTIALWKGIDQGYLCSLWRRFYLYTLIKLLLDQPGNILRFKLICAR